MAKKNETTVPAHNPSRPSLGKKPSRPKGKEWIDPRNQFAQNAFFAPNPPLHPTADERRTIEKR